MNLFDTATQHYHELPSTDPVLIYTCGITPYDSAHLGHIFTFMTYDLVQRYLEDQGRQVRLVRNITDVDEPIFVKARELGVPYQTLASQETDSFQKTLQALSFRPAYAEPKASDYIDEMAVAVDKLLESGYAYRLDDDIYFDVSKMPSFGSFSGLSERLQLAFMRRRGGDPGRAGKRQPLDFLLWRGIKDQADLAAWETPLGRGRPGWHIECSVMAESLLGSPLTIHGGGNDLIYPHHECEIAQSLSLGHAEMATRWVHVAPISYLGEKMSKSLGNLVFAKELLEHYEAPAIRLSLLHYHYRTGGEWNPEYLEEATLQVKALRALSDNVSEVLASQLLDGIRSALADDLDSHAILHSIEDFIAQASIAHGADAHGKGTATLHKALALLGLFL